MTTTKAEFLRYTCVPEARRVASIYGRMLADMDAEELRAAAWWLGDQIYFQMSKHEKKA